MDIDKALDILFDCSNYVPKGPIKDYYDEAFKLIRDCVKKQPKEGNWIETYDGWEGVYYECSECKEPWTTIEGTPEDNLMKFCPQCGSRMIETIRIPEKSEDDEE